MNSSPIFFGAVPNSRLGPIWVAASPLGLIAVEYGVPRTRFERALGARTRHASDYAPRRLRDATGQLKEYVAGRRQRFDLLIDWSALSSEFQRRALKAVLAIPYGETRTYAEIATAIGHPGAARAVGRANATNPMPLVIPCHRLVGSDGALRGYGGVGGLKTKAWLLHMEAGFA